MKWKKAKSKSKDAKQTAVTGRETSVSISIEPADWAKDIAEDVDKSLKDLGVENVTVCQSREHKKPVIPASELTIVPGTGCMSQKKKKKKGHKKTADELFYNMGFIKTVERDRRIEYKCGCYMIIIMKSKDGYSYRYIEEDTGNALWITRRIEKSIRRKAKEMGWS